MTGNTDRERVKRSILISVAVAALVGVFALGWYMIIGVDKPKDGPRVTVGKYMKAIRTKHIKDAQDLLCSGLAQDKQDVADRANRFRRLDYRIDKSTRKSDTEYRVDVAVNSVVELNGKDTPSRTTYVFKVVKEHGDWLVCGITT
ncbi:MAG: hypothetical protein ACRD3Q_05935 [Terriglobales bacterium]